MTGKVYSFIQQRGRGPMTDLSNSVARQIANLSAADFPESPLMFGPDGTISVRK